MAGRLREFFLDTLLVPVTPSGEYKKTAYKDGRSSNLVIPVIEKEYSRGLPSLKRKFSITQEPTAKPVEVLRFRGTNRFAVRGKGEIQAIETDTDEFSLGKTHVRVFEGTQVASTVVDNKSKVKVPSLKGEGLVWRNAALKVTGDAHFIDAPRGGKVVVGGNVAVVRIDAGGEGSIKGHVGRLVSTGLDVITSGRLGSLARKNPTHITVGNGVDEAYLSGHTNVKADIQEVIIDTAYGADPKTNKITGKIGNMTIK